MHRIDQFREHCVRDLAWVILSPPLIDGSAAGLEVLPQSWCESQFDAFLVHLKQLDLDPSPLLQVLSKANATRLGKYFEVLIAYWLETSPSFKVLARNLQIRDARQTYGELDLVVLDRLTQRTSHWEVAIKFYLNIGDSVDLFAWVGPNRRDSLGRKARHLLEQQGPRAAHPVAKALLAERGIQVDQARLFVKGRLFREANSMHLIDEIGAHKGTPRALSLAAQALWSAWRSVSDFAIFADSGGLLWRELHKPNWLVKQLPRDVEEDHSSLEKLLDLARERPILLVGTQAGMELERCFVVPDAWRSWPLT